MLIIVNLFSGTFLLEASKDLIFNTDTVYNTNAWKLISLRNNSTHIKPINPNYFNREWSFILSS